MPRKWTEQQKKRQAEIARRHKPWEKSTGPRTAEGKNRSKYNNLRHGFSGEAGQDFLAALARHKEFLRGLFPDMPKTDSEWNRYYKREARRRAKVALALRELTEHGITPKSSNFPKK